MLSKEDLEQIRKVVREEVENEAQNAKDDLNTQILRSRMSVLEETSE